LKNDFLAAGFPVDAWILHISGQVLQGYISGVDELLITGWTLVKYPSAVVADVVTFLAHGYRRQHILHAYRTFQFLEEVLRKCVHVLLPGDKKKYTLEAFLGPKKKAGNCYKGSGNFYHFGEM
jgi:hypothetical protein